MNLRPYQITSKDEIRDHFINGQKRVILCKPTGSGKTVTFASIAQDAVKLGSKVGIVVDRKELLEQAADKLKAYGLLPQIIRGQRKVNYNAKAFVATIQTLVNRPQPNLDLLIIDEAHKQTFDKLLTRPEYADTFVIGATATPMRSGRMTQLIDLYDCIVEPVTISELISEGFLMPAVTYAAKDGVDLKGVKTARGDYDAKTMYAAFDKSTLYSGVVHQYKKFSHNARAICFNVNVEHSEKTTASFIMHGVRAKHIDGSMSKGMRERLLSEWRAGVFDVLCNCDLFTTGFDEPSIETVIVNRATKSIPLWLQMCGRGSRPSGGKNDFVIIDMGANVYRLGFWEQNREYSLTHEYKASTGEAPVKECDPATGNKAGVYGCGAIVHLSARVCKYCDREFPIQEKKLLVSEFGKVDDSKTPLPDGLSDKRFKDMNLEELELVREFRGFAIGWLVRQVATRTDISIEDYAKLKGYKSGCIHITKKRLGL